MAAGDSIRKIAQSMREASTDRKLKIQQYIHTTKQLQNDVEASQRTCNDLRKNIDNNHQQVVQLERHMVEVTKKINDYADNQGEVSRLRTELEASTRLLTDTRKQIDTDQQQIQKIEHQAADVSKKINEHENILKAWESEAAQLERDASSMDQQATATDLTEQKLN